MTQRMVSFRFPYLPIQVTVGHTMHEEVEALLDTGFDGEVILSPALVKNGEPPDWYVTCRLADGSEVEVPAHVGSVRLGATELTPIVVTALGDEPILDLASSEPSSPAWTTGNR